MAGGNINRVIITGNLTRDPEMRSLPSGTSLCSLRIAPRRFLKTSSATPGGHCRGSDILRAPDAYNLITRLSLTLRLGGR